jgi:hypothetical protein
MIWGIDFVQPRKTRWLAYIKKAYGEVAPTAASCEDQGTLVVEDDDCSCAAFPPTEGKGFCNEY